MENNGGFSSVRTSKSATNDLATYDGLVMRVKGDGRSYEVRLGTDARYRFMEVSFKAMFPTKKGKWTEVKIPFDRFQGSFRGRDQVDFCTHGGYYAGSSLGAHR